MSTSEEVECEIVSLLDEGENDSVGSIPPKSREKYWSTYEAFIQWKSERNDESFSENIFLEYFNELVSKKFKPSTLWCYYSMLKSTVKTKNDIDIRTYPNLIAFLKKRSDGYVCKQSKVLSPADIEKFLKEASDYEYLATKVALIFGITGGCSRKDLCNMTTKDVKTKGEMLLVKVPTSRNNVPGSFVIQGPFYEIVKKYQRLRSKNAKSDRFFLNYHKGRCTAQPIGINKFGAMPKEIAKYLALPNADSYTGHSFRRTSAILLAESGVNILNLQRQGAWRPNVFSDTYIGNSICIKANISSKIASALNFEPPAKKLCIEPTLSNTTEHLCPCVRHSLACHKNNQSSLITQENIIGSKDSGTLEHDQDAQNNFQETRTNYKSHSRSPSSEVLVEVASIKKENMNDDSPWKSDSDSLWKDDTAGLCGPEYSILGEPSLCNLTSPRTCANRSRSPHRQKQTSKIVDDSGEVGSLTTDDEEDLVEVKLELQCDDENEKMMADPLTQNSAEGLLKEIHSHLQPLYLQPSTSTNSPMIKEEMGVEKYKEMVLELKKEVETLKADKENLMIENRNLAREIRELKQKNDIIEAPDSNDIQSISIDNELLRELAKENQRLSEKIFEYAEKIRNVNSKYKHESAENDQNVSGKLETLADKLKRLTEENKNIIFERDKLRDEVENLRMTLENISNIALKRDVDLQRKRERKKSDVCAEFKDSVSESSIES